MESRISLINKIVITIIFFLLGLVNCSVEPKDCYDCYHRTLPKTLSDLYNPSYSKKHVCTEEEAEALENSGWFCEGYPEYDTQTIEEYDPYAPGERIVTLISPGDHEVNIPLSNSLIWYENINWFNSQYEALDDVTFDVYLGTEANPTTIVSKDQTNCSFNPTLTNNTIFYWKVKAHHPIGILSESRVLSFKTRIATTYGTLIDNRDGQNYKTVNIVEQSWTGKDTTYIWMGENLAYEIPGKEIVNASSWSNNLSSDGWCYYNNDKDTYGNTYGILYQWEAAKKVCPEGWHLPSESEWEKLIQLNRTHQFAGGLLKDIGYIYWSQPNTGATNESGFTALPAGKRNTNGEFTNLWKNGYWWSSTKHLSIFNIYLMEYNSASVANSSDNGQQGISVRCIKD